VDVEFLQIAFGCHGHPLDPDVAGTLINAGGRMEGRVEPELGAVPFPRRPREKMFD
jgi:hypothetical protein